MSKSFSSVCQDPVEANREDERSGQAGAMSPSPMARSGSSGEGSSCWVAGWTQGGAPFGLTYDEWRRAQRDGESRAGWARRALSILEDLARANARPGTEVEVGRVVKIGEGPPPDEELGLIRRILKMAGGV